MMAGDVRGHTAGALWQTEASRVSSVEANNNSLVLPTLRGKTMTTTVWNYYNRDAPQSKHHPSHREETDQTWPQYKVRLGLHSLFAKARPDCEGHDSSRVDTSNEWMSRTPHTISSQSPHTTPFTKIETNILTLTSQSSHQGCNMESYENTVWRVTLSQY